MNPEENHNDGDQNNVHKDPVIDLTKQNNGTVMAVLSYLGPLVLVPYFVNTNDEFVKFHTKQGLVLFGVEVVIMVLSRMSVLWILSPILNLATLILTIIGIINAVQGHKKDLPLVGSLASNIKM